VTALNNCFSGGNPCQHHSANGDCTKVSDASFNIAYAAYGNITACMICAGVPAGGRDACQVRGS